MSHELTIREDGFVEHAYVGHVGWHGLGNALPEDAPMSEWVKAAGFDWEVLSDVVRFQSPDGTAHRVDDRRVLYRSDTLRDLSIVSDKYKVVQPKDILSYFDELIHRAGFKMNTAGTLFGGRQFWALADIGDTQFVADEKDQIKGRLLCATSVDLSMPTTVKFLSERVVCANTLSFGLMESGGSTVRVKHMNEFKPTQVNQKLGISMREQFNEAMEQFRKLASTPMDEMAMVRATAEIVRPQAFKLDADQLTAVLNSQTARSIGELSIDNKAKGATLNGAHGTAWAWLNSVTQHVDHESRAQSADARLSRSMFGEGDRMKTRALDLALDLAENENDNVFKSQYKQYEGLLREVLVTA